MENIFNLLPREEQEEERGTRYTSRFSETVKQEAEEKKSPGKLFGPKGGAKPDSTRYLKKGQGETLKKLSIKKSPQKKVEPTPLAPNPEPRLPSAVRRNVPRHDETAKLAPRTTKNYLKTNYKELKQTTPRKNTPKYIDKPGGSGGRHKLETSGMMPTYSSKPTYGKTPKYIQTLKEKQKAKESALQTQQLQTQESNSLRLLSEEERLQILSGLRKNLDILTHEFQGLSMITDTAPKKARRNRLEGKINELEADIQRLERYQQIYIDTGSG
eukprot:m.338989 g.338989  ORF g.338989 m.338989 type:complete len:271 (+) comp18622_c0_seq1:79-891(+)